MPNRPLKTADRSKLPLITFLTENLKPYKNLKIPKELQEQLEMWKECFLETTVIDGILIDNAFIAFDILVDNGFYLLGSTPIERYSILYHLTMGQPEEHEKDRLALRFTENLWLAECFLFNFKNELMNNGLLLRNINHKLGENNEKSIISCDI